MATKTIQASGGDYATPHLWWSYVAALGTLSAPEIGEMAAEEFNSGTLNMTGGTVVADATNRIILRAASGAEPTTPLRYGTGARILLDGNDEQIVADKDHITLENFAIKGSASSYSQFGYLRTTKRLDVKRLLIEHNKNAGFDDQGTNSADVRENIVCIRTADAGSSSWGCRVASANMTYKNCTVVSMVTTHASAAAFHRAYVAPIFINCVSYGYQLDWNSGFNTGSSKNCATSLASGSSGIASVTAAQFDVVSGDFVNTSAGTHDFAVASGSTKLKDLGAASGGTTTGILGNSISGGTRDIGADEYQAAGGSELLLKLIQQGAFL